METSGPTNVKYEVKDGMLVIAVNLKERNGMSKSGKSTVVASTGGNVRLPDGTFFGLNVYVKN